MRTQVVGIANNIVRLPYCMAGWMQSGEVQFGLQVSVDIAWRLPEIFPETRHGHLNAFTKVMARMKRDVLVHDLLVKHDLTIQDFPNRDPYGPADECYQIIETRGTQVYRGVYGGWLTRDTFEAIAFNVYGMTHKDFNAWFEALRSSELDVDVIREMSKAYNRFRRDSEAIR